MGGDPVPFLLWCGCTAGPSGRDAPDPIGAPEGEFLEKGARTVFKMVVGHSDDLDPGDAVAEVLEQCAGALDGIKPQAGLLFSAFDEDCERMVAAIN